MIVKIQGINLFSRYILSRKYDITLQNKKTDCKKIFRESFHYYHKDDLFLDLQKIVDKEMIS